MGIIQITVCLWFCTIQLAPCLSLFVIQLAPDRTPPLLQIELPIGSSTCQSLRSSPYSLQPSVSPTCLQMLKVFCANCKGRHFSSFNPQPLCFTSCVCMCMIEACVCVDGLVSFPLKCVRDVDAFPSQTALCWVFVLKCY